MPDESLILRSLADELAPMGFVSRNIGLSVSNVEVVATWVRKTWNTNRAVIAFRLPEGAEAGRLSQELKIQAGKAVGYFPIFYGVGLQLVWFGPIEPSGSTLANCVDAIDNQRSIVQSLFLVDLKASRVEIARTWGQVVTGRFQDAMARGIHRALSG